MPRYYVLHETIDRDTQHLLAGGQIQFVAIHTLAAFESVADLDTFVRESLPGIRRAIEGREKAEAAMRDTTIIPTGDVLRYDVSHESPVPHIAGQ
jgi:hypothetical protein